MTTDQLIYNTLRSDGIPAKLAEIMTAQSKGETGNYTHDFFTVGHNAFGYMYDRNSKWQIQPGRDADNHSPIAQYSKVENSVHEITDWIKRRQGDGKFPKDLSTITTVSKYTALLKSAGYYGASLSSYTKLVQNFLKAMKEKPVLSIAIAGSIILIAYGAYLYTNRKKIAA